MFSKYAAQRQTSNAISGELDCRHVVVAVSSLTVPKEEAMATELAYVCNKPETKNGTSLKRNLIRVRLQHLDRSLCRYGDRRIQRQSV